MKAVRAVLGAMLVWLLASVASAQAVAGSQLAGVIKDSSGGVLPGASVTIVKTDTAMTRSVTTGVDGTFVFPNLPVGPYQLKVALDGFNTLVQDGIVLQVNTNPTLDLTLTVGSIGEQVTVAASSAMLETRSTGVGQVIDNQQVTQIPLNGRQATELISVAGGQANGITYIMDGGTHNDPFNNLNLPTPFPDALQEFEVETSSLPARYGHHAASAVNLVTKSGTNSYRGNVFEFVNDRPMPFYFSPADLGASVYSPQPGYMGVSVTNGFNIGTGGTNPGYFNSDSLQVSRIPEAGRQPAWVDEAVRAGLLSPSHDC